MRIRTVNLFESIMIGIILLYPKVIDYIPAFQSAIRLIYLLQIFFVVVVIGFDIYQGMSKKKIIIDYFLILLLLFNVGYILSDSYNGVLSQTLMINIRRMLIVIAFYLYIRNAKVSKKKDFLKAVYYLLTLYMITHLIGAIAMPEGFARMVMYTDAGYVAWSDKIGFLDADNRVSLYVFLYFYISNIYINLGGSMNNYGKKYKYRRIFVYLLSLCNIILSKSGSGILAFCLLLIIIFLVKHKKNIGNILSWKGLMVFGCVIALFVSGKMNWLQYLVSQIVGKGMTLSGRTAIWEIAVKKIVHSPIWGYGTLEGGAFFQVGNYLWYAHNQYLDIWLQGGLLGVVCFFCLLVHTHKKIKKKALNADYLYFVAVLCGFLVMGVVEHFILRNYYQFFVFLSIAYVWHNITEVERVRVHEE